MNLVRIGHWLAGELPPKGGAHDSLRSCSLALPSRIRQRYQKRRRVQTILPKSKPGTFASPGFYAYSFIPYIFGVDLYERRQFFSAASANPMQAIYTFVKIFSDRSIAGIYAVQKCSYSGLHTSHEGMIMYSGPVIDAHMHLWDLANGYNWLSHHDSNFERLFGNYDSLKRNVLAADYLAVTRDYQVVKSVHVQAFGFPDNPVGETAWLQGQADRYGYPQGIVAYANLTHPDVEETLRQHCSYTNIRGIRMPLNYAEEAWRRMTDRDHYLRDAQWQRGFALLSRYGLSFDLQMYDHQAVDAVALAQRFPETTIIIEHLAWPLDLSPAGFEQWCQHLQALSQCPNVFLKLSGIGCVFGRSDPGWIRQWLQQAVKCFGPQRCLFGSNCPPDTIFYDFPTLLRIYREALADCSPDEQEAIFCGTAQRIYRL